MSINIGTTHLEYGLMLAPMAGFSDRAMRLVAKEFGAEYTTTEMVSAKAIVYGDKKTVKLMKTEVDEGPCAVQIFGSEPDIMGEAAAFISAGVEGAVMPSAIDINMGCPVPKIFKNGEGSALMRSPSLIEKIVASVKAKTHLPVTVKLRLGINANEINVLECALAAEAGGASLIVVHGRTREALYSGNASFTEIKKVKSQLKIPVVANGDIKSAEAAKEVLCYTGADGIMIGRGAVGNPFIFEEIRASLSGKEYEKPSVNKIAETALRQLRYAIDDKGEGMAVREARGQIAVYFHSFRGAAAFRATVNRATTYKEVESAVTALLDNMK